MKNDQEKWFKKSLDILASTLSKKNSTLFGLCIFLKNRLGILGAGTSPLTLSKNGLCLVSFFFIL